MVEQEKGDVGVNQTKAVDKRAERKFAAKQEKRKRIEASGGVRPRSEDKHQVPEKKQVPEKPEHKDLSPNNQTQNIHSPKIQTQNTHSPKNHSPNKKKSLVKVTYFERGGKGAKRDAEEAQVQEKQARQQPLKHRFGRVMSSVPCTNKPRFHTLSIAIPGSIVENCQTKELKTYLVGQLARSAGIYHVDEIVVFNDNLGQTRNLSQYRRFEKKQKTDVNNNKADKTSEENEEEKEEEKNEARTYSRSEPHEFMARILQFCECPQYLRRSLFPMHPDLQFSGLICPLDAPHHVRAEERSKYREGVVLDKPPGPNKGSYVNVGIRGKPVEIDRIITPGVRCTVKLENYDNDHIQGVVVSPAAPREENGMYWGYTTRLANSIKAVFDECPFEGGYDLKVGTSERGEITVDDKKFALPKHNHMLIVFGGVSGIEEVRVCKTWYSNSYGCNLIFVHFVNVNTVH